METNNKVAPRLNIIGVVCFGPVYVLKRFKAWVKGIGVRAIFCQGGALSHLPKKFSQVAQIFTKQ